MKIGTLRLHRNSSRVIITILIGILALGLRFARLGDWSFAGDELATIVEAKSLFGQVHVDSASQDYRLGRILPIAYAAQYFGYVTFGESEFGTRVVPALFGSILPPLIVYFLWLPLGGWSASAAGMLIVVSPEAIFHSQENRNYSAAALVAGACVVLATNAFTTGRLGLFLVACTLAIVAPLTHTVLAGLSIGIFVVACFTSLLTDHKANRIFILVAASTLLVVIGVVGVYQLPYLRGWNAQANWGYSLPRAVAGGVIQLGIPTVLLAGLGLLLMFAVHHQARWIWAMWAFGWVASVFVLPLILPFHPGYSFVYTIGPIVLAGYGIGEMARRLPGTGWLAGMWLLVATSLNFPALASHFVDGSRYNFREAAKYLSEQVQPNEDLIAMSQGNLVHYQPSLRKAVSLEQEKLLNLSNSVERQKQPVWLLLYAGRNGLPSEMQAWLLSNYRLVKIIREPRLDYYEFSIYIYKLEKKLL